MLISFRFKNAYSYYEETTLSLETTKDKTLEGLNTFTPSDNRPLSLKSDLVKCALIFGPNGSGKSNILKALDFMRYLVLNSSASSFLNPIHAASHFAFYECAKKEDSLYEVEFISNGTYYKYGFIINSNKIVLEWLDTTNERTRSLFKREGSRVYINKPNSRKLDLFDINQSALFLTIGSAFKTPIQDNIKDVINWFLKLNIVNSSSLNSLNLYNDHKEYQKEALDLLRRMDRSIVDLQVRKLEREEKLPNMSQFVFENRDSINTYDILSDSTYKDDLDIVFSFNVYDSKDNHNIVNKKDIPLHQGGGFISKGTEKLLTYLGFILDTLSKGGVIFIDDLDSYFSPELSSYLISMFNSYSNNPLNTQLVATVHNPTLMDKDLRRDQIYFTSKDNDGVSTLSCLSDFKDVRKSDKYSKKYLAGFYSYIPTLDRGI